MRLLSLDVALGAVSGGFLATGFLGQPMPWIWYVILPLAVWVIYTWDHLLDAHRLGTEGSTARHRFHHERFRPLLLATGLGAVGCVGLASLGLGSVGIFFGAGMGALALLHLAFVRVVGPRTSPFLVKELGVGTIYCVGIWGLPWIESGRAHDPVAWIGFAQFFLLAMTNLLEFSFFEREIDETDGHSSWIRAFGDRGAVRLIGGVLLLFVGLGCVGFVGYGSGPFLRLELTYLPMGLILGALLAHQEWFRRQERYRAWGDGAFLLPGIYRVIPWG